MLQKEKGDLKTEVGNENWFVSVGVLVQDTAEISPVTI